MGTQFLHNKDRKIWKKIDFLIKYFSKSKKKYMHTFKNLTINMKTKA